MQISVVRSGADLAKLSRELRHVGDGKTLRRQMTKELRSAAKPLVPAVRSAIRSIPTTGAGHTGLRSRMAKATRLRVKTSGRDAQVAILVDPAKMPAGQKALPMEMEGVKRWRHPVYGNTDVWVTQKPHPYFFRTVAPLGRKSKTAVNKVLKDLTRQIT